MCKVLSLSALFKSAIFGFLLASFLVIFPGFFSQQYGLRQGPHREVLDIYYGKLDTGIFLAESERQCADSLLLKAVLLSILKLELESMPFLVGTSILFPVILLVKRSLSSVSKGSSD